MSAGSMGELQPCRTYRGSLKWPEVRSESSLKATALLRLSVTDLKQQGESVKGKRWCKLMHPKKKKAGAQGKAKVLYAWG